MTSIPNISDISAQVGETVAKSQHLVTETVSAWVDYAVQAIQVPSFDEIPTPAQLVDNAFDQVHKVLELQRSTFKSLAETWAA
jgi:hypothetical protein